MGNDWIESKLDSGSKITFRRTLIEAVYEVYEHDELTVFQVSGHFHIVQIPYEAALKFLPKNLT